MAQHCADEHAIARLPCLMQVADAEQEAVLNWVPHMAKKKKPGNAPARDDAVDLATNDICVAPRLAISGAQKHSWFDEKEAYTKNGGAVGATQKKGGTVGAMQKKGGAVGAMPPTHYLSNPGGGGVAYKDRARPPPPRDCYTDRKINPLLLKA